MHPHQNQYQGDIQSRQRGRICDIIGGLTDGNSYYIKQCYF